MTDKSGPDIFGAAVRATDLHPLLRTGHEVRLFESFILTIHPANGKSPAEQEDCSHDHKSTRGRILIARQGELKQSEDDEDPSEDPHEAKTRPKHRLLSFEIVAIRNFVFDAHVF